jgi:hypothetical protein
VECNNFLDFKPIEYYASGIGPAENAKMAYDSQISFTLDTICPWYVTHQRSLSKGPVCNSVARGAVADRLSLKCRTYLAKKRYVGSVLCLQRELRLKTR